MDESSATGSLEEGCLQCLLYFGIFKYPLNLHEIHQFNPYPATLEETAETLDILKEKRRIFRYGDYFMEEDAPAWVEEREQGNRRARELLEKSGKYVSVIASFPFVKGIAISGSLSKFYASENPDIDYFIITRPDRLWIARSFLHLFKKFTFITGHQHFFCMNYFIDTEALQIENRNMYAAIELATLLPAYDRGTILEFFDHNRWVKEFLPNHPGIRNNDYLLPGRKRPFKKLFEMILNIFFPSRLNAFLMKMTDRKWRKKWSDHGYSEDDYNRAFQTELHISKNHPADYEKKVTHALGDKLKRVHI